MSPTFRPGRSPSDHVVFTDDERRFMQRALRLAARGRGATSPNPMVGAVLVQNGVVVGEGWHRRFGGPHAEAEALAKAGDAAKGATCYVALEPCAHTGKTPPCTEALLAAGVREVVAAQRDPNPKVTGGGAEWLAAHGIPVRVGLLEEEAELLNRGFLSVARSGRPWVTLKLASSLDGGIATASGRSKWITGEEARAEAHRLRAAHDGIVVGAATVVADDPELTVRHVRASNPARVVLDPKLRTSPKAQWLAADGARRIVVATAAAPAARRKAFEVAGAEVWILPTAPNGRGVVRGGVALPALLRRAAREGLLSLLVEGGGRLAGALLRARAADELALFLAPLLLGGDSKRWTPGLSVASPAKAPRLHAPRLKALGDDWLLTGGLRAPADTI